MAFIKEMVRTPTAIGGIEVVLYSADPAGGEGDGVRYSVQVRFSDGSVQVRTGNLVPELTTAQINGLLSFMADMRAKAVAGFLP